MNDPEMTMVKSDGTAHDVGQPQGVIVREEGSDVGPILKQLVRTGWAGRVAERVDFLRSLECGADTIDGLVVDLNLSADPGGALMRVDGFLEMVDTVQPYLRSRERGGAAIVAIGTRDAHGWPTRPRSAGASGALVSVVRSLAMELGAAGVSVNLVEVLPDNDSAEWCAGGSERSTHLRPPASLTPHPVGGDDVGAAVAFLLDRRSRYITGQVLSCCGGASLLSSRSA